MTSPTRAPQRRILLLEDDALLRDDILVPELSELSFEVVGIGTAAALHAHLACALYDIVIIDVGLPDADGFAVAREVREEFPEVGIVMLTGRGATVDRVRGLTAAADAYLSKPIEIELLAATLHSLARRLDRPAAPNPFQRWHLDASGWNLISPIGTHVELNKAERQVMRYVMTVAGQIVSRQALIACLADDVYDFDPHRLDSLIHRLRKKVAKTCGEPLPLAAVHREGYVLKVAL